MSAQDKETVYVDAEDDITTVIDKVRGSQSKIVALVLPKRAATFQSVVNLKLLKKTAAAAKKSVVLITSEASLLPIAGSVSLHVARTLQTKPEIPASPGAANALNDKDELINEPETALNPQSSVGELAGHVAAEETIELDNEVADAVAATAAIKPTKKSLNKKLKVPNFDRFRLLLFAGVGLLLLLIIGSVFAFVILPKAKVVVKTDTANINSDLNLTAKTDAKSVDSEKLILPALNKQVKKTDTEKVPATGQRDEGTKATGTMTVTNCSPDVVTIEAGTVFSSSNINFVSNEAISVPKSSYSFTAGGFVCDKNGFKNVGVTAQNAGGSSNLSSRSYSIANGATNVTATGSNMSGGTSKLVQIVSQADIDNARQKVVERQTNIATAELKGQFTTDSAQILTETFTAGNPSVTSTPNVNDAASEVNVTVTVTYSQLGVKQDDLKQIIENQVKKQIDNKKQTIQDNGLEKATLQVTDKKPNEAKFNLKALSIAGPQLDTEGIKNEIKGKKKRDAERIIKERPGINDAEITYSPFWVFSTPKSTKKITVIFQSSSDK